MNESTQVDWEHAVSRYMSVMPELVDLLQRDFIAGLALVDRWRASTPARRQS